MDIYSRGRKADTRDIDRGKKRLDDFAKSSTTAEKSVDRFGKETTKTSGAIAKANRSLDSFNGAFRIFSGLVGGLTIGKVVRDLAEFEAAMSKLESITFATGQEMTRFREQARMLGATTIKTAKEVAEAQTFFAMAGFDANQILAATPGIIQLSTAATIDLARAADIASNVLSGFGYEVDQFNRVSNVLVKAAASANVSVEQLGSSLSYVAPFAATAGLSIEEVTAALGKLGDAGLQGERGGTGMVGVIRQLSKVTPQAEMALAKYGITLDQLDVSVHGLQPVMELLGKTQMGLADTLRIFGTEAGPAAEILMKNAVAVKDLKNELLGAEGAMEKAASIIGGSLKGSLLSFNSAISESILQLGESQGYFKGLVDTVTGVISAYNGMLPLFAKNNSLTLEQVNNIQRLANTFAIVGTFAGVLMGVRTAMMAVTAAQLAFNLAVRANPYVMIAATATAAIVTILKLRDATSDITEVWEKAANSTEAYNAALSRLPEAELKLQKLANDRMKIEEDLAKQKAFLRGQEEKGLTAGVKYAEGIVKIREGQIAKTIEEENKLKNAIYDAATMFEKSKKREEQSAKDLVEKFRKMAADESEMMRRQAEERAAAAAALAEYEAGWNMLMKAADPVGAKLKEIEDGFKLLEKAMDMGESPEMIEKIRVYLEELKDELLIVESGSDDFGKAMKAAFDLMYPDDAQMRKLSEAMNTIDEMLERGLIKPDAAEKAINRLGEIGDKGKEVGKELEDAFSPLGRAIDEFANSTSKSVDTLRGMFDTGSSTYKQLTVMLNVLNAMQAVNAVLNQAAGDPYTAFGRMASMAAAVASLGYSVGAMGGGGAAPVTTGLTGSVLGDEKAKSDSIAKSTDITAKATSELVGINRAMLNALRQVQVGITGASSLVARGVGPSGIYSGDLGIGSIGEALKTSFALTPVGMIDQIVGGFATNLVGGIIGSFSSQKVVGEGIKIHSAALEDMMETVWVTSFASVKKSKFWGISSSTSTRDLGPLGDDVQRQFALVFKSISDSVTAGAEALGYAGKDIQEAILRFVPEEAVLQMMGKTAEEKQKMLEEYFSKVFDDLTKHTIPWLIDFQRAGEGIGETLARVATQVQVFEYGIENLFNITGLVSSPQIMAGFAEHLSDLVGGVEELAKSMSSFISNFSTEQQKFDMLSDGLTKQLERQNLILPETREGFMSLMNAQNAATESGRENIAVLLQASDTAAEYYKMLEDQNRKRISLETEIAQLMGDTEKVAQLQIEARMLELETMTDAEKVLQRQLWYLQDNAEKEAELLRISDEADARQSARDAERLNIELEIWRLQGDVNKIREHELYLLDESNRALKERLWSLEDEKKATDAAKDAAKNSLNNMIGDLERGITSVKSAIDRLDGGAKIESQANALAKLQEALFTRDYGNIDQLASQAASIEMSQFESVTAYERQIGMTRNTLKALEKAMESDLQAYKTELEYLDDLTNISKRQLAALETIAGGKFVNVPGFAGGGDHSGGLRIVGEKGPELEYTGPSSIVNQSQINNLLDMSGIKKELQMMREEMKISQYQIAKNTGNIEKILKRWNGDGLPEERVAI